MTNQLKGTLYYLYTNVKFTLLIFWSIIVGILALSLIASFLMSEGIISFQLSISVYIFCMIIGGWTVKNAIPYTVKLGSTRKNLYVSLGIYFLGFSLFNSLIANMLNKFVEVVFDISQVEVVFDGSHVEGFVGISATSDTGSFTFFHLAQFLESDSWLTFVIVDASICFFILTTAFIVGLVFYKYGLIGGFSFLGIIMFTIILGIAKGWLIDLFINIFKDYSIVFFYQLFAVGLIIYLVSFIFLRRITL